MKEFSEGINGANWNVILTLKKRIMAAMEGGISQELTPRYYALCTIGGMLSAGTTHLATTPLDVLKVNMQVGCIFIPVFI